MVDLRRFLIRRLITFIPTLIGATLLVYFVAAVVPGNPAKLWAGGEKASAEVVQRIIEEYKLDEPWYVQYYYFMKMLLTGKAISPVTHTNVWAEVLDRFKTVTLPLTMLSFMFIILIGIPLGIISAIKKDTVVDMILRIFALTGISMPIFWLAYLLIAALTGKGLVTLAGFPMPAYSITGIPLIDGLLKGDFEYLSQLLKRLWLPSLLLSYAGIGVLVRLVRNSFLDAYSSDFVEFMLARGFPRRRIYIHVLRNALAPIVTVLGLQFGGLLAGAVITETIFGLPGMGSYMIRAINNFDYLSLMAGVLYVAIIFMVVNLVVDILYAIIDPRVRY